MITRSTRTGRFEGESGVTLILVALLISIIMIFVALIVDLGPVYNARRQNQTAADGGALAGAQDLATLKSNIKSTAVSTIKSEVVNNLTGLGSTTTSLNWDSCSTSTSLWTSLSMSAYTGSNCIAFDNAGTRVGVHVPSQAFAANFGKVFGFSSYSTSAVAVAQLKRPNGGGILPFAFYPSDCSTTTMLCCFKDASSSSIPGCPSTAGNFGSLDSPHIGNATIPTISTCPGSPTNTDYFNNIAEGLDHRLQKYPGDATHSIDDCAGYTATTSSFDPDQIRTSPGFNPNDFKKGMLDYTAPAPLYDSKGAHLTRTDYSTRTFGSSADDNYPLWEFLPLIPSGTVPPSCDRTIVTFTPSGSTTGLTFSGSGLARMETCLHDYANPPAGTTYDPLFTVQSSANVSGGVYDIQRSPRLAFVPVMPAELPMGSTLIQIQGFRAVWLQTTYLSCGGGCTTWDPDPTVTGSLSSGTVNGMTVFNIPDGALPFSNTDPFSFPTEVTVQLVK